MLTLRRANDADVIPLSQLYEAAVNAIGPERYSDAQVHAWAQSTRDAASFRDFLLTPMTLVAIDQDQIVGFGGVADDGHITSLYVHPLHSRQGIGTAILDELTDHAISAGANRLYSEASHFSYPLFLKSAFVDAGTEVVERNGVSFVRLLVEKSL